MRCRHDRARQGLSHRICTIRSSDSLIVRMSRSYDRHERLKLIESMLPLAEAGGVAGLSANQVAQKLANTMPELALNKRTIERDLKDLLSEERVQISGKSGRTNIFVRPSQDDDIDGPVWEYFMEHLRSELDGIVSNTDLAKVLTRLKRPSPGIALDEKKICILPDNLRLKPAAINYKVFSTVLKALKEAHSVRIKYKNRLDATSEPVVHPLGIMQRGPRIYLIALKEDGEGKESDRKYALDRILNAEICKSVRKKNIDFSFSEYIATGKADFSDGEMIQFEAVVSGYVETLLYDCPLNDTQDLVPIEGEEMGSALTVTIPSSGQLLRWILSCGSNIKVLAPAELRHTVSEQISKVNASYQ